MVIDRADELGLLGRRAGDRVNVRLVGPRRYGKTTLVLAHADQMREAGFALGLPRWRVTSRILYRAAQSAIITGVLLSIARIAGETAPLLFTALNNQFWSTDLNAPMANLPVVIFQFAMSPYADWQVLAWGGALLITTAVLFLNIGARALASWSTFKQ